MRRARTEQHGAGDQADLFPAVRPPAPLADPQTKVSRRPHRQEAKEVSPAYEAYLRSERWQRFRRQALAQYNWRCAFCGETRRLQVHHLHYENFRFETLEDVIVVCQLCHPKADRARCAGRDILKYCRDEVRERIIHAREEQARRTFYSPKHWDLRHRWIQEQEERRCLLQRAADTNAGREHSTPP